MIPLKITRFSAISLLLLSTFIWNYSMAAELDTESLTPEQEAISVTPDEQFPAKSEEPVLPDPEQEEKIRQALIDKQRYEQVITQLEIDAIQDVYGAEFGEVYMGLGFALRTLEQHEDAAFAFDKALQSVRISNGLNSLQQLPILYELKTSKELNADWDAVDANAHLIFHIARKNFQPGDERRMQALDQLGKWKLKAASEDLISGYRDYASEAADLYKFEIRQLNATENLAGKNIQIASLYLGEAQAKLNVAKRVMDRPLSDYQTGTPRTITQQRCYLVRLPDGKVTQVCETVEVPNINYYADPANRKNMDISRNLSDVRNGIVDTYEILENEISFPEKRDMLLIELLELTQAFNQFVEDHSL